MYPDVRLAEPSRVDFVSPAPSLPQSISPWVDVRLHGASIDPTVDSTGPIESAFRRAGQLASRPATSGAPPTAVVKFPAGGYKISRPIFVPSGVEVWGDGWCSRVEMSGDRRFPAFVYGVAEPNVQPDDRPDLFGILDTSAAPLAGARRGWSTAGGLAIQGQFTSANIGPYIDESRTYWEGAESFTLDLAIVVPEGGFPTSTPLLGCGRSCVVNDPRPWAVWTSPTTGWIVLSLGTTDRPIGFATALPADRVVKLSWQVDLKAGVATCWINGVQTGLVVDGLKPGMKLTANSVYPLHIGRQGLAVATTKEPPTSFTLAGLRLGTRPRYAVSSQGSAQTRIDGRTLDDAYRFFDRTDQRGTVGFFPFDDPAGQRWLRWTPGDGLDECVLVMRGGQGGGKPARLADLSAWSRGPAVLLGAVLDWRGDNLRLQSETGAAVGSVPIVMSYPITFRGCTLSGGDAAVSLSQAIIAMRDCKIESQGRDGIRLIGSSLDATNTFASFCPPQGLAFLRSFPGAEGDVVIRLDRAVIDYEDRGPRDALIVCDAEPQHPMMLRVSDLSAALTGVDADHPNPIVRLSTAPRAGLAKAVIGHVASGKHNGLVAGGAGWMVTVPPAHAIPQQL